MGNGTRLADAATLQAMRDVLTPSWMAIHRSDLAWNRSSVLPATASHAMCRHAAAFLKRVAIDADRLCGVRPRSPDALSSRWKAARGSVDLDRLPIIPDYLRRNAQHWVVMGPDGTVIDLTADQFGLDPVTPTHWSATFPDEPDLCDPGLAGSARQWAMHPSYGALVAAVARRS